jgi:hypothetical protein
MLFWRVNFRLTFPFSKSIASENNG